MIPEIGHYALILGLCLALLQGLFSLTGAAAGIRNWQAVSIPLARAQFLFVFIAYICLSYAFLTDDFSVSYVASNSNTAMPIIYKISAVWGAHEGSLLLWTLFLSLWAAAVSVFSRSLPLIILSRVLGVLALVAVGFLLFMLLTSNPFDRLFPIPVQGRTLNPLLQDFGLAVHPPMLYMGYVGFSVVFAFAIAALMGGRLDAAWARWARPWTNVAWMFLTIGIALGSWWAYYELGWGGWWFWDPVENASFMPWLVGTALIHSLAVTEKRGLFKSWTVLLAIFAFSLSLLGTFLVRSGVLTSVHAFATDPERGVFILFFLAIVIGGSLLLYAWRAPHLKASGEFKLVSRETGILINNILLMVFMVTVLLGTLYPLIVDALGLGKISVGPPYFNTLFVPLMIPIAILMVIGAMTRWKRDDLSRLIKHLTIPLLISLVAGFSLPYLLANSTDWRAITGVMLGSWVALGTLQGLYDRVSSRPNKFAALLKIPRGFYGMTLAHLGIAWFIVGISLTTSYSIEKDVRLAPGEQYQLGKFSYRFDGIEKIKGPNYIATEGTVTVTGDQQKPLVLRAQKRHYGQGTMPMTEAAIDAGFTRDVYVSLGDPLGKDDAWSVRLYYKPFIRWIWLGAIFMGLGGLIAVTDRRYRTQVAKEEAATFDGVAPVNA